MQLDPEVLHRKSVGVEIRVPQQDCGRRTGVESAWRGLLSLRDPTALTGRSGHPDDWRVDRNPGGPILFESLPTPGSPGLNQKPIDRFAFAEGHGAADGCRHFF